MLRSYCFEALDCFGVAEAEIGELEFGLEQGFVDCCCLRIGFAALC